MGWQFDCWTAGVRRRLGPTLYGGRVLNYLHQGRGVPLVLVHGIGSHWQMWSPVLGRVAAERDVLAVDVPGFGRSPVLDRTPTIAALADAVSELAAEHGIRPHLAGNSLGGAIALELARTGRARSATVLSPIGFAHGRERAYGGAVLKASRALARALGGVLDAPQRTAPAAHDWASDRAPVARAGRGRDPRRTISPTRRGSTRPSPT
jgi:pimeloyl-ACP methyl ester carboxylesterase